MGIQIRKDKKTIIPTITVAVLAVAGWLYVRYSFWWLMLFLAAFAAVQLPEPELPEKVTAYLKKVPWIWAAVFFVPGAWLSVYSMQYLLLTEEEFAKLSDQKWMLNILCVLVVYLLCLVITNRVAASCVIAQSLFLVVAFTDYFVYAVRKNEVIFADLRTIRTGISVAAQYRFSFPAKGVIVLMWAALFLAFVCRFSIRFAGRVPMTVVGLLLAVLCGVTVANRAMGYNTETWEMKGTYRNGYVLNFLLSIRDSMISEPEGYSAEAVEQLEERYGGDGSGYSLTVEKEPTIIVIMNESFADLGVIGEEGLITNRALTPFLDSLNDNTMRGYALASVFGAKTPNSEWEFQTGHTMAFLPGGSVVYQQYLDEKPASLVTTLKEHDYTCLAMHPYYATGWSRNKVYPQLGYDGMSFLEDFDQTQILREYITDKELYRKIIERYEAREEGEKLYVLGVTMQNHGGYTTTYENFPETFYKTGRSYTDVNQYLSLVHESDEALEYLIDYFDEVEEPVEIVFFGDHQPSLNSRFYQMMNGKGLSGLTLAELEDLYKVPFVIWTNYETEARTVPVTSLNYLSTLTLERAGIALPAYHQFLADMMEAIPAVNARGYYSAADGVYRHVEDAEGEEAEWFRKYRILQYNAMFDQKHRSSLFFPYYGKED